jgi:hypothetical protein
VTWLAATSPEGGFADGCRLDQHAKTTGTYTKDFTVVLDLKHLAGRAITDNIKDVAKQIVSLCQDHNPERLAKLFILNVPAAFWPLWGKIQPVLGKDTKKKVPPRRRERMVVHTTRYPRHRFLQIDRFGHD